LKRKMSDSLNSSFERYRERRSLLLSQIDLLLNLVEALDIAALRSEIQRARDRFDSHNLKVLVAGELNSGKSTIVNALLRTKALPAYPVPTTALLTQVKRGGQAMVFLHQHPSIDGAPLPPLELALTDIERHLVLDHKREPAHAFERVELHLPLPSRYRGIEFIDPPSPWDDDSYEKSLASEVPSANAVIYALGSDSLPSKEEALRIDWVCRAGHATPFFLCNRFDLVEPHSQKLVKRRYFAYLSQLVHQSEDFIFFTDAKGALEGYLQGDMQRLGQSQWPRVEDALYDYLARGSGEQSVLRAIANLQSMVSRTRQIISLKKGLQQTPVQERNEARAALLEQSKQIAARRQHIADQFSAARQRVGKEAKTAATAFYSACLNTLERAMQSYTPRHTDSLWYVFSGDSSERMAKDIITFLTETIRDQFQSWVTTTLEPLLQEKLHPIEAELLQDMVRQMTQAVERRVNCLWHPTILVKRLLEATQLESGTTLEEIRTCVFHVYRSELEKSTLSLVDAITNSIDSIVCQRQQELDHLLEVEFQCLSDVVRTSVEEEQAQAYGENNADTRLLPALEDELYAIERVLNDLL
jgi:Dynamin family